MGFHFCYPLGNNLKVTKVKKAPRGALKVTVKKAYFLSQHLTRRFPWFLSRVGA